MKRSRREIVTDGAAAERDAFASPVEGGGSVGSSIRFDALLRAHGFMIIERPPEIWEAATDDVTFIPLLGEMIAAALAGGLARGLALADLTLNVSNVVVEHSSDERDADPPWVEAGEYVAVTVSGATELGSDSVWRPRAPPAATELLGRLDQRLSTAGARFAYVRKLPSSASVTIFLDRLTAE